MTAAYHKNLTSLEAEKRLLENGPNVLPEQKTLSVAIVFFRQFKSPFIYVLLIAALVSYILGQTINSVFILIVLLINALIGTIQEYSAEQAATALKKMVPSFATVIRNNKPQKINTAELHVK